MFVERVQSLIQRYPEVEELAGLGANYHDIFDKLDAAARIFTKYKPPSMEPCECGPVHMIGSLCEHRNPVGVRLAQHEAHASYYRAEKPPTTT
jgi:hypothetical protein